MEAQEEFVLKFLFEFEYRERNGPLSCFDSFSFFFSKIFFWFTFLLNANVNAHDAYDMFMMHKQY